MIAITDECIEIDSSSSCKKHVRPLKRRRFASEPKRSTRSRGGHKGGPLCSDRAKLSPYRMSSTRSSLALSPFLEDKKPFSVCRSYRPPLEALAWGWWNNQQTTPHPPHRPKPESHATLHPLLPSRRLFVPHAATLPNTSSGTPPLARASTRAQSRQRGTCAKFVAAKSSRRTKPGEPIFVPASSSRRIPLLVPSLATK